MKAAAVNVLVLVNSAAGSVATSSLSDQQITQAFVPHAVELTIQRVGGSELEQAARAGLAGAFDVIVAAGGDGTVSAVAKALVDSGKPLGILPLGTLNHFAKDLGLPLDLAQAAAVICRGQSRLVDVGEVNALTFINNSSIGIYPAMVRNREEQRLRWGRSKVWAMVIASVRVLRRFPLLNVRLNAPQQRLDRRTPFVFVGNNAYQINLLSLGARSCLDAGQLSLYVANCSTRWALLRMVWRTLLGTLDQATDFDSLCISDLTVETPKHHIAVALDGEVLHLRPPLHYRVRPRALRVVS